MVKRSLTVVGVVAVAVLAVAALAVWIFPGDAEAARLRANSGSGWGPSGGRGEALPVQPLPGTTSVDLSEDEEEALLSALEDEYKAWAVYEQVLSDFGEVRPFPNIQQAEENHIAALTSLLERCGVKVPENEWVGSVPSYDTLGEACAAGVQAEIDNAALYDQLLSMTDNDEILRVFTALQRASQTKHLPAFEFCAS